MNQAFVNKARRISWLLLQIAVAAANVSFGIVFSVEALGRFYLWAMENHFHKYVNHVSDYGVLMGNCALLTSLLALRIRKNAPKSLLVMERWLLIFSVIVLISYWIMRRTGGLVTYDEFVSHGV